jgi:hypothetical protein
MVEYVMNGAVFVAYERAPSGTESVRNYKDLQRLGESWDGKTLVGLYNNLASNQGVNPVKKFTNRETGIKRLWGLLEQLPVTTVAARGKKGLVLDLVQRPSGATLDEIMDATGWQAHSVRGFLSVQRRDYTIERRNRAEDVIAYYANKK